MCDNYIIVMEEYMSSLIKIKKRQLERLENLAQKTGKTKTYYVSKAIDEYLDELEFLSLMEQRLAKVNSGESKTTPFEEVRKKYGL